MEEEDNAATKLQGAARIRKSKAVVAEKREQKQGATVLQNKMRAKKAKETVRVKRKFAALDANGNGVLEGEEIRSLATWVLASFKPDGRTALPEAEVEQVVALLMAQVDADNDGKLDFAEFQAFYAKITIDIANYKRAAAREAKAARQEPTEDVAATRLQGAARIRKSKAAVAEKREQKQGATVLQNKMRAKKAKETVRVKRKFAALDANGNGVLEGEEVKALARWVLASFKPDGRTALPEAEVEQVVALLMAQVDADNDGKLDFREFQAFYAKITIDITNFKRAAAREARQQFAARKAAEFAAEEAAANAPVGDELTAERVGAALGGLARSPDTLAHVFSRVDLRGAGLGVVDALGGFPHLQHVDVADNGIADLAALAQLPHLLTLDASGNRLRAALAFEAPRCRHGNAWPAGDAAVGSTLQVADLSRNRITAMPSDERLGAHRFLRSLTLDGNAIGAIGGLGALRCLQTLSLRGNALTTAAGIGAAKACPLTALHLDGNRLSSLAELDALPCLATLTLRGNRLASLEGLRGCAALKHLDLRDNAVAAVAEVESLSALALLSELSLRGCPVAALPYYRRRVLYRAQQVASLDGVVVSAEEKVKALNLHGADLPNRQAVFGAVLPGANFEDVLPPFEEPEGEGDRKWQKQQELEQTINAAAADLVDETLNDSISSLADTRQ